MFGLFRRKATSAALSAVRPLIATLRVRGPIPRAALHDPYFLGFIGVVTMFHVQLATKMNASNIGSVMQEVLREIGGEHQPTMAQALFEYANGRHPDYMQGLHDGDNMCALTYGLQKTSTGSIVAIAPDPDAAQSVIQKFLQHLNSKYR